MTSLVVGDTAAPFAPLGKERDRARKSTIAAADAVARAVLYEGFSLYPYRASSLKNTKRLLFGTLMPEGGDGPREASTEVLVIADAPDARLRVMVRFLAFEPDREELVEIGDIPLEGEVEHGFVRGPVRGAVIATASRATVRVRGGVPRSSAKLLCAAAAAANAGDGKAFEPYVANVRAGPSTHRLRVVIKNEGLGHHEVLAMGAAHVVVAIEKGRFVSSIDPPSELAEEAAGCKNAGLFPVLVGPRGATDAMLASPIILYDYPEIAGESAGDLFDATEIEEILSLRILTLTDDEKKELRGNPRTRALLERVERLAPIDLARLHGALRRSEGSEASLVGARVRLRPTTDVDRKKRVRADAIDVVLRGMSATVISVEHTVDGDELLCVTIDADPGRDLGAAGIPGHRFFFRRDEVEVVRVAIAGGASA